MDRVFVVVFDRCYSDYSTSCEVVGYKCYSNYQGALDELHRIGACRGIDIKEGAMSFREYPDPSSKDFYVYHIIELYNLNG